MKRTNIISVISVVMSMVTVSLSAQSVNGSVTVNERSKLNIELETNSVVALFKDFKTKTYELRFNFEAQDIPKNMYGETIVFFDFVTQVKKDSKLVKEVKREEPFPYFPGDMFLAPETFDFISVLSNIDGNDADNPKHLGTLPEGNYKVTLKAIPKGFDGEINPLDIYFVLRRRPTR